VVALPQLVVDVPAEHLRNRIQARKAHKRCSSRPRMPGSPRSQPSTNTGGGPATNSDAMTSICTATVVIVTLVLIPQVGPLARHIHTFLTRRPTGGIASTTWWSIAISARVLLIAAACRVEHICAALGRMNSRKPTISGPPIGPHDLLRTLEQNLASRPRYSGTRRPYMVTAILEPSCRTSACRAAERGFAGYPSAATRAGRYRRVLNRKVDPELVPAMAAVTLLREGC
jgi:hypothetical protein